MRPPFHVGRLAQAYFRSGWVFLLPYLVAYLAYMTLKYPVHPRSGSMIPSLLHVYWLLHALHMLLVVVALRQWLRDSTPSTRWSAVPWMLLGVFFIIPGTYLEFPADPWEHYARINRWHGIYEFGQGLGWYYKQTYYFFAYSILGNFPVGPQLKGLDFYQAALCLLLSFQTYRLARACRLGSAGALLVSLLQPLLLGNDLWGFNRYYILSSSGFAQLAAVAAIRIAVELTDSLILPKGSVTGRLSRVSIAVQLAAIGLALGFSALNHIQGAAIAGLGLFAVIMWHAAKTLRHLFPFLAGFVVLAGVASSLWWPRHPALDEMYRAQGWLNWWHGFALFTPDSNAWRRMTLILGAVGFVNLAAGLLLLRRNDVVGWLTLMPIIALQLGFISVPLANAFAQSFPAGIVAFHRVFFAIPAGLALVALGEHIYDRLGHPDGGFGKGDVRGLGPRLLPVGLLVLTLCYFTLAPPSYPFCNRLWNNCAVVPRDLQMRDILISFYGHPEPYPKLVVTSAGISNALQAYRPIESLFSSQDRLFHGSGARTPVTDLMLIRNFYRSAAPIPPSTYLAPQPFLMFTPRSETAVLAGHWNPVELSLAHTADFRSTQ